MVRHQGGRTISMYVLIHFILIFIVLQIYDGHSWWAQCKIYAVRSMIRQAAKQNVSKEKKVVQPGIEPGTFCDITDVRQKS